MTTTFTTLLSGNVDVVPAIHSLNTTETYSTIISSDWLRQRALASGVSLSPIDMIMAGYAGNSFTLLRPIFNADGTISARPYNLNISNPVTVGHFPVFIDQNGTIGDVGYLPSNGALSTVIMSNGSLASGALMVTADTAGTAVTGAAATNSFTTSSATPGTIRSLSSSMSGTATVMTSGTLVGVKGEVDCVGASGGSIYGVEGKVAATGTLSSTSSTAGVFGQFDISTATINAGLLAPIWADYGATSGTITSATGMRMFAGTNNTAATLNSMIYLNGKTSNLFELLANGSTYISTGGATASGTIKKIAILIEGVQYYLQAATVYS
jgi:hypothetical protein